MPEIKSKAPDFSTPDQNNETKTLADYKGKWLVIYFYPKDNTPGCTTEAITFSQNIQTYTDLNTQVVGVSADSCESHRKFITKKKLKVTLLSDPDHTMLEAYGVWQLKKMMGREYMGIVRTTFIIDPEGNIAHIYPKVKVKEHAREVLEKLKELQG